KAASNEALDSGKELEQLFALFTSVRAYSRESAETISTAMRTIIGRLQRADTITYFGNLGIQLRDLDGNFIGAYNAIQKISSALKNTPTGSSQFAEIVEQIGGVRQISKVIPLLTQMSTAQEVLNVALNAGAETDKDVAKAKESLANKIERLQSNFSALITEVTETKGFNLFADALINVSNSLVELTRSVKEFLPYFGIIF
ncbi:MAG: phage tail tape measure protein, partial [Planktothrix sp.]